MWSARSSSILSAAMLLVWAQVAGASILLEDANSRAELDPSGAGAVSWKIDGVNRLAQHRYWYRVGSSGPEMPLMSLTSMGMFLSDTNLNPGNDHLFVRLGNGANPSFTVTLSMVLSGGSPGSGSATIGEVIVVNNLTAAPLDLHLFRYSDFDLNGPASIDEAMFVNANTLRQTNAISGATVETSVVSPSRWQVGDALTLLGSLNDPIRTDLANAVPLFSGNGALAFQWDVNLPANRTWMTSTNTQIVTIPEPAGLSLLAATAVLLARRGRKPTACPPTAQAW